MLDINRYRHKTPGPSKRSLEKTCLVINNNLAEMKLIVDRISRDKECLSDADKHRLLYYGSYLYDFYLLTEENLLLIARISDKWVPGSLDWRTRLINLMQSPVPDKRPPVLSTQTASLLADYLGLFLNYHHQCSTLSAPRIIKMIDKLDHLYNQLEKELTFITEVLTKIR